MVSPIGCLTTLDDPEYVEIWIRCFEALAKVKKLRDRWNEGGAKWNYWHVPRNSRVRNNPESFNDHLPMKSRTDFHRNWWGNKKKYQTKEKVSHRRKNKVSGNKTVPRWAYCKVRTLIERKSEILRIWKTWHRWNDHRRCIDYVTLDRKYARPSF